MLLYCLYYFVPHFHLFFLSLCYNGMWYDTNANIFLENNDLMEICKILGLFYCRLRMKQPISIILLNLLSHNFLGSSTYEKRPNDYCFFCPVTFVTVTNGELTQWTLLLLKISI